MRRALCPVVAVAATVAAVGVGGAPEAAARPATATLAYTCQVPIPVVPEQRIRARLDADIPGTVAVGARSRRFPIDAATTAAAEFAPLLARFGVASVEGTVTAGIGVATPQGDRQVAVTLAIPRTPVPDSGSFVLTAHGTAPVMTFSRPGPGRLTAGNLALHFIGRAADGSERGVIDVGCQPQSGRPAALGSFTITRPPTDPGPSHTPGTPGPSRPADRATGGPGPTGHRPASGPLARAGDDLGLVLLPAVGTLAAGVAAWWDGAGQQQDRASGDRS